MEADTNVPVSIWENAKRLRILSEITENVFPHSLRRYLIEQYRDEAALVRCPTSLGMPELSVTERDRYSRQILFAGGGTQQRLKAAVITVLGAGGAGTPCLYYLAGAGVGKIRVIDQDVVERSNLNRQILYGEADIGTQKVEALRQRLEDFNSDILIDPICTHVTRDNIAELIRGSDFVVGAIDDHFIVSAGCVEMGLPFAIPAAVTSSFGGTLFVSGMRGRAPCFACAFNPGMPPKNRGERTTGVFGFVPGAVGAIAALEAVKAILYLPRRVGTLTHFDMWSGNIRTFQVPPRPDCECHGTMEVQLSDG